MKKLILLSALILSALSIQAQQYLNVHYWANKEELEGLLMLSTYQPVVAILDYNSVSPLRSGLAYTRKDTLGTFQGGPNWIDLGVHNEKDEAMINYSAFKALWITNSLFYEKKKITPIKASN